MVNNMINPFFRPILLSGLLATLILTTACTPKNDVQQNNDSETKNTSQEVMDQLKTKPIKAFPNTLDDAHDIAVLEEYQQKLAENNNALEADLKKRSVEGNLTAEINHQLKRDGIESALTMLKELDLKTEQGRYIQGLYYQYWENQAKIYDEKKPSTTPTTPERDHPSDTLKGMGDMLTADEQLEHWKGTQPKK